MTEDKAGVYRSEKSNSVFSPDAINAAVDHAMAKDGNTFDVGVTADQDGPNFTLEAQGEHKQLTWGAWARTNFTKAKTAVGAKLGFRW